MATLALRAPAKINLGLRLVGRREDGYHELESLFLPLELADRIELRAEAGKPAVELTLEPADSRVPEGADNLVARAADAFLRVSGLDASVHLLLRKEIPVPPCWRFGLTAWDERRR